MRRIFADDGIAYPRVSEPDDIIIHTAMLLPPAIDGIDRGRRAWDVVKRRWSRIAAAVD
jgi:hypothetical protein